MLATSSRTLKIALHNFELRERRGDRAGQPRDTKGKGLTMGAREQQEIAKIAKMTLPERCPSSEILRQEAS
jgi:hypothetical protein